MMDRVEPLVQSLVHVHQSMQEILPCVDEQKASKNLQSRYSVHVAVVEGDIRNDLGYAGTQFPHSVLFEPSHVGGLEVQKDVSYNGLYDVLQDHFGEDVEPGGLVPLGNLFAGMDPISFGQMEGVYAVKYTGQRPVGNNGSDQRQHSIAHLR